MRIGILTFHRSLNYGAVIQCYSLQQQISKEYPDDVVEVIDYSVKRVQKKYSYKAFTYIFSSLPEIKRAGIKTVIKITAKNALTICNNKGFLKKRKQMRKAFDSVLDKMVLSKESFQSDNCLRATKWLQGKYDVIIVGSDCVWEINNYPFPNIYFLHDIHGTKKLSYAACAQGVLFESLDEKQRNYMREAWSDFAYISVRDAATEALLHKIDEHLVVHQNCDPTVFLRIEELPIDLTLLRAKFVSAGVDFQKPTICLMANPQIGKLCRDAFGDEYQIVAIYEQNPYADYFVFDLNPFEWARCFSLFSITITNRFHGTLLSMKNGTPVITFDCSTSDDYSFNGLTKIRYLYDQIGLTSEQYRVLKKDFNEYDISDLRITANKIQNSDYIKQMSTKLHEQRANYAIFSSMLRKIIDDK